MLLGAAIGVATFWVASVMAVLILFVVSERASRQG
jgi:hypothetical protein